MSQQFNPSTDVIVTLNNLQRFGTIVKNEIGKISWYGTKEQFDAAVAANKIPEGAIVNITNDYEDKEFYTKEEVNRMISAIPKFDVVVTQDHTTITNPSRTTIYIQDGESGVNLYTEWIYTDEGWHKLGEQPVTTVVINEDGTLYI